MKKLLILMLFILVTQFEGISASLGCMDNSYHGECCDGEGRVCRDYKQYHYVACPCPCTDIISKRGTCRRCSHFGRPDRGEINAYGCLDYMFR